jgi:protease-4
MFWKIKILFSKIGKKVVASVGSYAASGGYYISAPCDKIIAQPGSILGLLLLK